MAVGSNLNYQAQIDSLVAEVKALAGLQFPDGYVESVVEAYLEENHANLATLENLNDMKYEILSDIQEDLSGLLSKSGGTMTGDLEMKNSSILMESEEGSEVEFFIKSSDGQYARIKSGSVEVYQYDSDWQEWIKILVESGKIKFFTSDFDSNYTYDGVVGSQIYFLDSEATRYFFENGNIHPYIKDADMQSSRPDLGTSSQKWNNIYATNGTIQTSDRNEKENIADMTDEHSKAFIMGLNPVSYKMKNGTSGRTHYGLIAQDIEALLAELGISSTDFAGFIKSPKIVEKMDEKGKITRTEIKGEYNFALRYDEFIAPLIKVVQAQQTEIEELKTTLNELKQK